MLKTLIHCDQYPCELHYVHSVEGSALDTGTTEAGLVLAAIVGFIELGKIQESRCWITSTLGVAF